MRFMMTQSGVRPEAFHKLPLPVRVWVAVLFLLCNTMVVFGFIPLSWLAGAGVLLALGGALRLTAGRLLLVLFISIPFFVGLAVSGFNWHHPFLRRYVGASFYLVAAGLLTDGIRIEEWIRVFTRIRRKRGWCTLIAERTIDSMLGIAVGRISVGQAVRGEREARRMASVGSWAGKRRLAHLLDQLALPFRSVVESFEALEVALSSWNQRTARNALQAGPAVESASTAAKLGRPLVGPALLFGNSSRVCRLVDVYDFPRFTEFVAYVFSSAPIAPLWMQKVESLSPSDSVLEIGPGSGRLTAKLLERGISVTAVERHELFCRRLARLEESWPGLLSVIGGVFPDVDLRQYKHVLLHQNVFLELINQRGLKTILKALNDVRTCDGRILLDFPARFSPQANGIIYQGEAGEVGRVKYEYSYNGSSRGVHSATLSYEISQAKNWFCVRTPLEFFLPDIGDVLSEAQNSHLRATVSPLVDTLTFFDCRLQLIELTAWTELP